MKNLNILSLVLLVCLLGLFHNANGKLDVNYTNEENDVMDQWKEMDKTMTKMVGSAIKMMLPEVMESANKLNLSSECVNQGIQLVSGVRRLKVWAFNFVDSSTKMIDGILSGTFASLGVYDQCLDSEAPSRDPNKPLFRGQYCQIAIVPPLPPKSKKYKFSDKLEELKNFTGSEVLNFVVQRAGILYSHPFKSGLCVPSGCNRNDINQVVKTMAKKLHLLAKVNFCEVREEITFSPVATFTIVFCCLLAVIVLLATMVECYLANLGVEFDNNKLKLFLSFSLITNFRTFSSTETPLENLKCLHGIRFMAITMVVMGNSYLYPVFMITMYKSLLHAYDMMTYPFGQMITNSGVAIDTFFFLGGLLVCYLTVKLEKIDKQKLNIRGFVLHRLWRIAPVYYFIILVTMLTPLMGSGPNFREAMKFSIDDCHKYWWTNLLFINNFFVFNEMCMVHTWYVACDLQLYLAALIVLLTLIRSEKIGIILCVLIIGVSMLYTGLMTYFYELIPGLYLEYLDKDFYAETVLKTYGNPLTHAGPYFIGVLVGYALVMKPDIKTPKKYQIIGWLIAIGCAGYSMFWTAQWRSHTPSLLETSIYSSFYRVTWAVGIAWMTFCCCTGQGGFINTFLTWSPWIPLAKLSFLIYLIQPTLQTMYIGVFKSTHDFTHFELVVTYFGLLLMSGLLALLCKMLIESPLAFVEKIFLEKSGTKTVDLDSLAGIEKYANGVLRQESKPDSEMNDVSGFGDNKAFSRTDL